MPTDRDKWEMQAQRGVASTGRPFCLSGNWMVGVGQRPDHLHLWMAGWHPTGTHKASKAAVHPVWAWSVEVRCWSLVAYTAGSVYVRTDWGSEPSPVLHTSLLELAQRQVWLNSTPNITFGISACSLSWQFQPCRNSTLVFYATAAMFIILWL